MAPSSAAVRKEVRARRVRDRRRGLQPGRGGRGELAEEARGGREKWTVRGGGGLTAGDERVLQLLEGFLGFGFK